MRRSIVILFFVIMLMPQMVSSKIVTLSGLVEEPKKTVEQTTTPQTANVVNQNYNNVSSSPAAFVRNVMNENWNSPLGRGSYTGDWDDEILAPHGEGVMLFDDGSIYFGGFVDGNFEGSSCCYYMPSGERFKGAFKGNLWKEGEYVTPDGEFIFKGEFRANPGETVSSPWNGTWYNKSGAIEQTVREGR
ncbi:MAG: hypothetical protein J6X81_05330 [Muribaculaceae bacterium]|nr:hypothetical protein [Muribaculaceae bacterium]